MISLGMAVMVESEDQLWSYILFMNELKNIRTISKEHPY